MDLNMLEVIIMKRIVIRSMTDANKLIEMGNQMVMIDRDRNNRSYLIFLFYNTEKLKNDLEIITKKNKLN
jgi:hypothetical protein